MCSPRYSCPISVSRRRPSPYYERAIRIQEQFAASDPNDRQAHFDAAANYGKLGDAIWRVDPRRALDLYERALRTAQKLVSKEQYDDLLSAYRTAIIRPLISLGRTAEARKAWSEVLQQAAADPPKQYLDRLQDLSMRQLLPSLLLAEGNHDEARRPSRI